MCTLYRASDVMMTNELDDLKSHWSGRDYKHSGIEGVTNQVRNLIGQRKTTSIGVTNQVWEVVSLMAFK
jgi:hypothetical protein